MRQTIEYENSDQLALATIWHNSGPKTATLIAVVVGILVYLLVMTLTALGVLTFPGAVTVVAVCMAVVLGGYGWLFCSSRNAALYALARMPDRQIRVTIADDALEFRSAIAQVHFTWEMLDSIRCYPDQWQLTFLNTNVALPTASLNDGLREFLVGKAAEYGVKIYGKR